MVDVLDVEPAKKSSKTAGNTFYNWLSSGFVSMMHDMQANAEARLPKAGAEDAVDLEEPYSERTDADPFECFEDGWHSELMEKYQMTRRGSRY